MNIFRQKDYRQVIKAYSKRHKLSFRQLALTTQIHTSYFSRVMQGNADFSSEQLFRLALAMDLNECETEYILLLGEASRSAHHEHRNFVEQRLQRIQIEQLKLIQQLNQVEKNLSGEAFDLYFREIITAKIHMLLTIPHFQKNPSEIANFLSVTSRVLQNHFDLLEKIGVLVRNDKGEIQLIKTAIHLDENHAISRQNHKNWRIDALNHLASSEAQSSDYHLSACFTCDEETKSQVKELLKDAIVRAQKTITENPKSEQLCSISLDLYS